MVALVSVVTAGSCHIEAVGVVHHSRTRGAHSCIPVSECRSVASVHLRCLTLEQLSGLTSGLRLNGGPAWPDHRDLPGCGALVSS